MTTTTDTTPPAAAAAPDPIILRRDLAALLGGLSGETMRRWMRDGKLPPPDVDLSLRTRGWKRSTLVAAGIRV